MIHGIQAVNLQPVSPGLAPLNGMPAGDVTQSKEGSFKNLLLDSIHQVNSMQQHADRLVETLVTGGDVNPAEVLTAVQKADLTIRMMMQIRNKVLQAFEEVRNIRI